ncbi:MAG: hypothetical protein M1831_004164 [Alyxoria varia]|nr:MAG: hypothetical protein M1831_004164 [Alyxoria varia]
MQRPTDDSEVGDDVVPNLRALHTAHKLTLGVGYLHFLADQTALPTRSRSLTTEYLERLRDEGPSSLVNMLDALEDLRQGIITASYQIYGPERLGEPPVLSQTRANVGFDHLRQLTVADDNDTEWGEPSSTMHQPPSFDPRTIAGDLQDPPAQYRGAFASQFAKVGRLAPYPPVKKRQAQTQAPIDARIPGQQHVKSTESEPTFTPRVALATVHEAEGEAAGRRAGMMDYTSAGHRPIASSPTLGRSHHVRFSSGGSGSADSVTIGAPSEPTHTQGAQYSRLSSTSGIGGMNVSGAPSTPTHQTSHLSLSNLAGGSPGGTVYGSPSPRQHQHQGQSQTGTPTQTQTHSHTRSTSSSGISTRPTQLTTLMAQPHSVATPAGARKFLDLAVAAEEDPGVKSLEPWEWSEMMGRVVEGYERMGAEKERYGREYGRLLGEMEGLQDRVEGMGGSGKGKGM